MTTRALRDSDIPALEAMAKASGFEYPDLRSARIEAVQVVVDEEDRPIAAAAAQRILELYLYGTPMAPALKLAAIRDLHKALAGELRGKGWSEVNVFLPESIQASFGRRLERSFGWIPNLRSWFLRF